MQRMRGQWCLCCAPLRVESRREGASAGADPTPSVSSAAIPAGSQRPPDPCLLMPPQVREKSLAAPARSRRRVTAVGSVATPAAAHGLGIEDCGRAVASDPDRELALVHKVLAREPHLAGGWEWSAVREAADTANAFGPDRGPPRRTGLGCGETHRHRLVLVVPLGARLRGAAGVLALARAEHSLIDFVPEGEAKQGAKAL